MRSDADRAGLPSRACPADRVSLPLGLTLYRGLVGLLGPLAPMILKRRIARGKEDPERWRERLGHARLDRPAGRLVWVHAASVGESLVALTIAERLTRAHPGLTVLMTSGTRTSARLIAERAGERVLHHFVPIDRLDAVRRFLDQWQPDLAVFAESELWPNLIVETARAGTPMALVNARMNAASLKNWRRWPQSARWLLSCFDWIGPADQRTARGLSRLLGGELSPVGNLKLEAEAPAPDPEKLAGVRLAAGGRPVWVAASTHAGEEDILIEAHLRLLERHPGALMILAPRHPERAGEVMEWLRTKGLSFARRSAGESPQRETPVWLADTLGEMGLWFTASPAAFIAGSLKPGIGGHNPLEATRAGAVAISGPHTASFEDVYQAYGKAGAVMIAQSAGDIARAVEAVWRGEGPGPDTGREAIRALSGGALDITIQALDHLLDPPPEPDEDD